MTTDTITTPSTEELSARAVAVVDHKKWAKIKNGAIRSAIERFVADPTSVALAYFADKLVKAEGLLSSWDEETRVNRLRNLEADRLKAVQAGWFRHFAKAHPQEAALLQQTLPADASHEVMNPVKDALTLGRTESKAHALKVKQQKADSLDQRIARIMAELADDFNHGFSNEDVYNFGIVQGFRKEDLMALEREAFNEECRKVSKSIDAFYAWLGGSESDGHGDPRSERKLRGMGFSPIVDDVPQGKRGGKRRHR